MGILESLFGGGGASQYDMYGDLFSDKQKAALRDRDMGSGLLRMAGALAEAAKPTLLPGGGIGSAIGKAAAAMGAGGDESMDRMLKGMQTAELVRASQQKRALQSRISPILLRVIEQQNGLPSGSLAPAAAAAPAETTAPASPAAAPDPGSGLPTRFGLGAQPDRSQYGFPARPGTAPPALLPMPPAPPGGRVTPADYGVPDAPGAGSSLGPLAPPDELVAQTAPEQGLLARIAAMQQQGGGAGGARLPFQLASAVTPGAAGAGGDDVLDRVVAPLESGNRNIMQQVIGPQGGYNPSVGRVTGPSSAGGYYQITNSTWKDTAPKAGVDLDQYPAAMTAPRVVQKQVAQKLYEERGLQPWADFNPAVAAATGYRRGGRFAGMGPDAGGGVRGGADDGGMSALTGLLSLVSGSGSEGLSPPDTVLPSDSSEAERPAARLASAALAPFATGNAVLGAPSSVAGVGPDLSGRIEAMVQNMPPDVRERFLITSGFRDAQRQAQVNPEVTNSRHMHGAAVDLAKDPVVLDWINRNGKQYGVGFPLSADPREINHLEMVDARGGRAPLPGQDYVIPSGRGVSPGMLRNVADTGGGAAPSGVIPGLGMTPQGLAALNALTEMGGLGDPFKSLLETYYKSPGYLSEKTTAETKARTDVEDPINQRMKVLETALQMRKDGILYNPQTGEIKADPEWDKIHDRRAEDTKVLELDYAKKLKTFEEQQKIAEETRKDQKEISPQPIYRGGVIVEQPMTRAAAVARLKEQSMRPGEYRDGDIVAKPIGNLSPDHQYKMSPTGGLTVEPITGTPGAQKAAEAADRKLQAEQQRLLGRDIVVTEVDNIKNNIGTAVLPTTGFGGSILQHLGGTAANNIRVSRQTLEARMSTDAINAMRAASPTGAALGSASDADMAILRTALANLDQSQTKEQFVERLERVKQVYVDAVHGPGTSRLLPDARVLKTPTAPSSNAAPSGQPRIGRYNPATGRVDYR